MLCREAPVSKHDGPTHVVRPAWDDRQRVPASRRHAVQQPTQDHPESSCCGFET
jgi:hypothetical protein